MQIVIKWINVNYIFFILRIIDNYIGIIINYLNMIYQEKKFYINDFSLNNCIYVRYVLKVILINYRYGT